MTRQLAHLDKQVYDLNRACMIGEHWLAFKALYYPNKLSCACGRIIRSRAVGFVPPKDGPVYALPVNINNEPNNYGAGFAKRAIDKFVSGGGKLPAWAFESTSRFTPQSQESQETVK